MLLQPSDSDASYDLSLSESSDKYAYNGVRTSGDGKYVLIFDPVKKHFVLHRIDSTFNMNLVSSPREQDASTLQSQYPQLEPSTKPKSAAPQRKPAKATKNTPAPKVEPKRRKSVQAKKAKPPPVREPSPEEEDSDDGLTIEYPDAPVTQSYQYQPTPIFQREVSEEISDEDAEGEDYESERNQDVDHLKLPSPANNNAGGLSDEDLEQDLEAELEQALANDSSESEEE